MFFNVKRASLVQLKYFLTFKDFQLKHNKLVWFLFTFFKVRHEAIHLKVYYVHNKELKTIFSAKDASLLHKIGYGYNTDPR